ncbi:MAG TPA: hypothetical protein VEU62_22770, partial [Bryobacterales bacterium]|nr:hypothetical protein [Bryobacterales bacterium]
MPGQRMVRVWGTLVCAGWLLLASRAPAECIRILVHDPEGLPVAGARVASGMAAARSGTDGVAMLCGVARGRHKVAIEAANFAAAAVEAEAPGEQTVALALAPRVESPVVVTGTPEPRQLAEVDRSITVIPVENAVAPGDSLAALLKTDSAVDVRERGPDGTQADVGIRGA